MGPGKGKQEECAVASVQVDIQVNSRVPVFPLDVVAVSPGTSAKLIMVLWKIYLSLQLTTCHHSLTGGILSHCFSKQTRNTVTFHFGRFEYYVGRKTPLCLICVIEFIYLQI